MNMLCHAIVSASDTWNDITKSLPLEYLIFGNVKHINILCINCTIEPALKKLITVCVE